MDGAALEGDRMLKDVMRPADSHTLEVVRGNGVASRGTAASVAPMDLDLDFADPSLSLSARPTPPPSPPTSVPPPTSAEELRQQGRQQALQRAQERAAAAQDLGWAPVPSGGGSLPVPLEMSRGVEPNPQQRPIDPAAAARFGGASGREPGGGLGGGEVAGGLGGRLGGGGGIGGGHMKAALKRQMEADQAAAAGADQSLAEAVEAAQAQESLETSAPPRSRRLASAAKLVQQGEWGEISQHSAAATKKGLLTVIREARDRHSVLQVAAPHEVDKHGRDMDDPFRLRDMQTCQVRRLRTSLLLTTHSLLLQYSSLVTAWSDSLLTTHHSLGRTHYSLLTTHCSLLTAHYSLLTAHYSLLTTHLGDA